MMKDFKLSLKLPSNTDIKELNFVIACELYKRGLIGSKEVVEQFGIERITFIENAGKYGVEIISETTEELEEFAEKMKAFK